METPSEFQTGFTRGVGKSLDSAVIDIPTAIEENRLNPFILCALCNNLTNCFGCGNITASLVAPGIGIQRRGSDQSATVRVIDNLRVNVFVAAKHTQPRTSLVSAQMLANSFVNPKSYDVGIAFRHDYLPPAFPA